MEPSVAFTDAGALPHLTALADLFNQCFARQAVLLSGGCRSWTELATEPSLRQPGLVATFQFSGGGAACLFPQPLLPDWVSHPDHEQRQRLQELAWEWSRYACPTAGDAVRAAARHVADLAEFVSRLQPESGALVQEISVQEDGRLTGTLFLIGRLPCEPPTDDVIPEGVSDPSASAGGPDLLARLRSIPVPVSVRLAEKRISISQLLGMTPGSLITFSKRFDDLLDLYVNNALYCRGEAVKIGENFGLKINEVGVTAEQPTRLVNA